MPTFVCSGRGVGLALDACRQRSRRGTRVSQEHGYCIDSIAPALTQVHDVIPADGAIVHDDVCGRDQVSWALCGGPDRNAPHDHNATAWN